MGQVSDGNFIAGLVKGTLEKYPAELESYLPGRKLC